ncbi:hypothetical protein Salat_0117300 [Sesamum alatum]|uniref:Uncharacterized protein n=1 Tax=Sesamum alatum TaxID=300844 RepID=A0AAE1YY07_9LAMI|nr:hypothetical protein Salat_0117300 [Sesamum alatum]
MILALLRSSVIDVTALDMLLQGSIYSRSLMFQLISNYLALNGLPFDSVPDKRRPSSVAHSSGDWLFLEHGEFLRRQQGSLVDSRYSYDNGADKPPTTLMLGPKYLSENYKYEEADSFLRLLMLQDWTLATMLVRPVYLYTEEDMSRELALSSERYGSVSRVYIMTDEDKLQEKSCSSG